ncbi:MAG: ROK family transcriptional regulator [Lachnospiraceae bacterium]|nr:ROK family transcriptional regulator [Lachnospiraceae bacterium]
MHTNFTVSMLKIQNKKSILNYIYTQKRTTSQIIAENLNLSRPTVTQILKELVQDGIIYQSGLAESTGGRKANMYLFNSSSKVAIGLEMLIDRYELIAIDLYGETVKYEKFTYTFGNTEEYYARVCTSVNQFVDSLQTTADQILGVGIALQGLISSDGKKIIYGKILNCTGLTIDQFSSRIPYKCTFNHDAESVANEELWLNPKLDNAIFFNIRDNLSGAVIINGKFFKGGELKSGVFEHMTIIPNGLPCYCGKKGCVNAYCSISALLRPEEDINVFFQMLRVKKAPYVKRWNQYLEYLAIAIDNLRMFINSDVILGGTLAKYLVEDDIKKIHELVRKLSAFPESSQYIGISRCVSLPLCMGAALPFVKDYLDHFMELKYV